ncbi:hypothetical protein QJS66_19400 [Kocuria rhizophila]|nr:hypothetical protein QJS66_19400 [Kocuria rhizophila]
MSRSRPPSPRSPRPPAASWARPCRAWATTLADLLRAWHGPRIYRLGPRRVTASTSPAPASTDRRHPDVQPAAW